MPYFAWDVSTSIIGVCLLSDDGQALRFSFIEPGKMNGMNEKYVYVNVQIPMLIEQWSRELCFDPLDAHHFIEDRLGNFSKGQTRLQTLMLLSAMNAVVTSCIINYGQSDSRRVTHILPIVAKKWAGLKVPKGADKKKHTIEFARSYSPIFPFSQTKNGNPKKGVEDMADALLTGVAGLRMRAAGAFTPRQTPSLKKEPRGTKDRKKGKGRVRLPVPVLQTP